MADPTHTSPAAERQAAKNPDYLNLNSLLSTFHISPSTKAPTSTKKTLTSLPAEIILKIASYFHDDYIFCKLTDNLWILSDVKPTNLTLTSATILPPTFYHICPYAALAMTNRYLWTVIPRPLPRPMPLEIIEEAEAFLRVARGETGDHWAREYGKMRGVEMMRWKEGEGKEKSEGFVSVEDGKSKYGVKLYDWDDYDY